MIKINYIKNIHAIIYERLALMGFTKRDSGVAIKKVTKDVVGWVGLNKAIYSHGGALAINPVVGVRNQCVEALVAELCGEVYSDYFPPTLAGNVGYMTHDNEYAQFVFCEDGGDNEVIDKMVGYIDEFGGCFIKKNTDLSILLDSMRTVRFANGDLSIYRIPAALYLLGEYDCLVNNVKEELTKLGVRSDPAASRFRRFTSNLFDRVSREKREERS